MLYDAEVYRRPMWPQVNAYYSKTYDGFDMPVHAHDNAEVMYVFSGKCEVWAAPEGEEPFALEMRAGDFIFLDAHIRHRLSVDAALRCTMLNVEFTLAPAQGMFTLSALRAESADYAWFVALGAAWCAGNDVDGSLLRAMDALVRALEGGEGGEAACRAEMALVLMRLSGVIRSGRQRPGATGYVRRAAGYIQQNYQRALSLETVAARVGISPDHLGRLFRAETGLTVAHYIERVRVDHAAVLLERSRLNVAEVGAQVGLMTRQRFDAAFRRRFGLPPGQYRQKLRAAARGAGGMPQRSGARRRAPCAGGDV